MTLAAAGEIKRPVFSVDKCELGFVFRRPPWSREFGLTRKTTTRCRRTRPPVQKQKGREEKGKSVGNDLLHK